MYTISKTFGFSASHQLEGLEAGHPCSRLHGHNYQVTVELTTAMLDGVGMVHDYRALAIFKAWLDAHLDHAHLNDVMEANPTAEALAALCHQVAANTLRLPDRITLAVGVSETPATWAWYRP